jgi:tight adherence protein C
MTGVILLGLAAGAGVWLAVTALLPAAPTLAATIAAVTATQPAPPPPATAGWLRPFTSPARALQRRGLPTRRTRQDLVICDREPLSFLATVIAAAVAGGLAPALLLAAITAGFGAGSLLVPMWVALAGAAAGATIVAVRLRAQATVRRAQLRAALSVILDITVVALSGGAGVEQALTEATSPRLGTGWALRTLQTQVTAAGRAGVSSWHHFGHLGTATGVGQLVDLAAAVALTGTEGAHIRDSLAARAETLRARQAADLKAAARSATQRMILPLMLIGLGYLLFLIFPAIYVLTHSL